MPAQLRKPASVGALGGSPDYFAWTNQGATALTVWRIGTDHYDEFSSHDGRHFFQFLQFSGRFLVWFAATGSAVMDLTTAVGFDITGAVSASTDSIVVSELVQPGQPKDAVQSYRVSRIVTASAPPLAICA